MSNSTIVRRIELACESFDNGEITLAELIPVLAQCTESLEGLPYSETRTLLDIVDALKIESHYASEGCEFERQTEKLLRQFRRNVSAFVADAG